MTWTYDGKHDELHDDEIRRALADLPRERAAEGFTERVLRRLDESPKPHPTTRETFRHLRRQPALAGAVLALVLVAVLLAVGALRPAHDGTGSEDEEPIVARADGPAVDSRAASLADPQNPTQKAATAGETRPEVAALLEELRREHTRLTRDLRDLRELAEGSQVIYVGGDESLDFVLELSPEGPPETGSGAVRPASLPSSGPGGQRFF